MVFAAYILCALVISEVVDQRTAHAAGVGAGAVGGILHLHGVAAGLHQRGHGGGLGVVVGAAVGGEHVVPVKICRAEVHPHAGAVLGVGYAARALRGVLIVIHHLCHGRCHAAAGVVRGSVHVVGPVLVPLRCAERADAAVVGNLGRGADERRIGLRPFDLGGILVEPCACRGRDAVQAQHRPVEIGKQGRHHVVGAHHECAGVVREDIVGGVSGLCLRRCDEPQGSLGAGLHLGGGGDGGAVETCQRLFGGEDGGLGNAEGQKGCKCG